MKNKLKRIYLKDVNGKYTSCAIEVEEEVPITKLTKDDVRFYNKLIEEEANGCKI